MKKSKAAFSLPVAAPIFFIVSIFFAAIAIAETKSPTAALFDAALVQTNMQTIPAGSFRMGNADVASASPVHVVHIKMFALAKYPVTRAEFATFIDATNYDAGSSWRNPRLRQSERDPVVNIDWAAAQAYAKWVSQKAQQHFRLPSEAEWEYAARAGSATAYYWGDAVESGHADCSACGSRWDNNSTAPVGSFAANAWGLFDMAGNVWQWTQDCYNDNYQGAPIDGSAWMQGDCKYRVIRGGSWNDSPSNVRVDARDANLPDFRYTNVGFRLAQDRE